MTVRPARESDFLHLETFVWQAIFPAFDLPDLSAAQKAENDAMVETARPEVLAALADPNGLVFVAIDPKTRTLAGYLIADAAPRAYAEINVLVVKRSFWGKGVGEKLLAEATNRIGEDRALSLAVRNFNERAKAFFKKHGFVDTGETTGDHAIPRTLMLREAFETAETPTMEDEKNTGYADDFPSSANEPVFEALPDYRLATDETPLYATGENKLSTTPPEDRLFDETTLDEKTLTELEAFIARARALKGTSAPAEGFTPVSPRPQPSGKIPVLAKKPAPPHTESDKKKDPTVGEVSNPRDIPFEVDFGDGRVETTNVPPPPASAGKTVNETNKTPIIARGKPSFEFAFTAPSEAPVEVSRGLPQDPGSKELLREEAAAEAEKEQMTTVPTGADSSNRKVKECPDCMTKLPPAARFCFSCGYPQPEEGAVAAGAQAPEEDFLVLEELPTERSGGVSANSLVSDPAVGSDRAESSEVPANQVGKEPVVVKQTARRPSGAISTKKYTMAELKQAFREHFQERVIAYFGAPKLKKYYAVLEGSTTFQQLRDGSLTNLLSWINGGERTYAGVAHRIHGTMADLTEYFIVEVAGDLSGKVLPQRLLRHQSVDWETVDMFKLVMDYLDFEAEAERVYTEFVSMPDRALRNATNSFLRAGKDERIFFICDQSLISQAKNGFAVTDAGIYWKNVLQPAGSALYTTMEKVSLGQGHLEVDGQFFNAGARLNLKMAVLLDKLRRMGQALE